MILMSLKIFIDFALLLFEHFKAFYLFISVRKGRTENVLTCNKVNNHDQLGEF